MSPKEWTAWELTCDLSRRPTVRVAVVDAYGAITNEYTRTRSTSSAEAPSIPWAMYLTDAEQQYWFICFDLDGKAGRPDLDAGKLGVWLYDVGIPYLVTESGPTGGRHVWIGLAEPIAAQVVHQVAHLAASQLRTLDLSSLKNPVTGAVRPPGTPHRHGGISRVIEGHVGLLTSPTVEVADVDRLLAYLIELCGELPPRAKPTRTEDVTVDDRGRAYIPSADRRTPTFDRRRAGASADASAELARVLTRAVKAGMRFDEVLAIAPTSPAFAHAFTARVGGYDAHARSPRPDRTARAVLERQWDRAVTWVASTPTAFTADDAGFPARAHQVVQLVDALQDRADASPGRWARHGAGPAQSAGSGRYSDRLILDALCLLALQAVQPVVEASDRALSAVAAVGRETARTALLRLADDGWIVQDTSAEGIRGAKWRLRDLSTGKTDMDRSQVPPPPSLPAAALRNVWIAKLRGRISATAHDVFAAPRSLGRTAGRVYAHLVDDELLTIEQVARFAGLSPLTVRRYLPRLAHNGLVLSGGGLWQRSPVDNRTEAATWLHVAGYLEHRKRRYEVERQAWAWWQAELEHRRAPSGSRRRKRRHATQATIFAIPGSPAEFPIHPRRRDGRADFAAALHVVAAGILTDEETLGRMADAA